MVQNLFLSCEFCHFAEIRALAVRKLPLYSSISLFNDGCFPFFAPFLRFDFPLRLPLTCWLGCSSCCSAVSTVEAAGEPIRASWTVGCLRHLATVLE